jgi:hypothetical protein
MKRKSDNSFLVIIWGLVALFMLGLIGCADGKDGKNGSSCSVSNAEGGALILCEDGTSSLLLHGATSPTSIVEIIRPCNSNELLLRLGNRELIAHYSDGPKQYLTFVTPGTWRLTDGSSCVFTVHDNLDVTW